MLIYVMENKEKGYFMPAFYPDEEKGYVIPHWETRDIMVALSQGEDFIDFGFELMHVRPEVYEEIASTFPDNEGLIKWTVDSDIDAWLYPKIKQPFYIYPDAVDRGFTLVVDDIDLKIASDSYYDEINTLDKNVLITRVDYLAEDGNDKSWWTSNKAALMAEEPGVQERWKARYEKKIKEECGLK